MDSANLSQAPNTDNSFRFITTQNPESARDPAVRRQVRSHAVKHALQDKRKLERELSANFRPASISAARISVVEKGTQTSQSLGKLYSPLASAYTSPRLEVLISHHAAKEAAEPVFSVANDVAFQTFPLVFRTGRDDPALLNAILLTFALAVTGGIMNQECLGYQNMAMSTIRERISSPDRPVSVATLGAILLLAGVEARLGMPLQVQLHMTAISQLLDLCRASDVYLTDGIKRAIFWQDLNTSVITGSKRVVDHTTFPELQWRRDPFSLNYFILPPGFQDQTHLFTEEFVEVLKDIHALQCIRDSSDFIAEDTLMMVNLDNHHASIESRLAGLPNSSLFSECVHFAAYLCACMLCCKVYRHSVIPSQISAKLLQKLEQVHGDSIWDHWDGQTSCLLWLIFIGGSFAPVGTKSGYIELLRFKYATRFANRYQSWPAVHEVLKQFIWSEKAFSSQVKTFWEDASFVPNANRNFD
ncbi:uncharacterized protein LY89DRAFT_648891 [Mollisia scopiformis]|uniref:Transcription factor domain-containing protein n=1 Tax=Mollisia scopiformis TaxID=149040 RepID=A0A194X5T2_MOLSC|nr:uncharacterized protein LY89DRAFT_648891 [Mollisia scopiformis]KUJ15540.1 hypothetical protein LY89DRAFT_648891 [Mollisia scopiformis]